MKIIIVVLVTVCFKQHLIAQIPKEPAPMKGYKAILNDRFVKKIWPDVKDRDLNLLIELSLDKRNRYNSIIPLIVTAPLLDTVVHFFYADQLKSMGKRKARLKLYNRPDSVPSGAVAIVGMDELKKWQRLDFDSVFNVMTKNMIVNTETFDMDRFLDLNLDELCCENLSRNETFFIAYSFFINGILLTRNHIYGGRLQFVPY